MTIEFIACGEIEPYLYAAGSGTKRCPTCRTIDRDEWIRLVNRQYDEEVAEVEMGRKAKLAEAEE